MKKLEAVRALMTLAAFVYLWVYLIVNVIKYIPHTAAIIAVSYLLVGQIFTLVDAIRLAKHLKKNNCDVE